MYQVQCLGSGVNGVQRCYNEDFKKYIENEWLIFECKTCKAKHKIADISELITMDFIHYYT